MHATLTASASKIAIRDLGARLSAIRPAAQRRHAPLDVITYCSYNNMRIEFDPRKDVANRALHGVSLAIAEELDWGAALVWVDDRFEYDELRLIALAPAMSTLYYAVFVERGEVCRMISLRRAKRREVKHYVESI